MKKRRSFLIVSSILIAAIIGLVLLNRKTVNNSANGDNRSLTLKFYYVYRENEGGDIALKKIINNFNLSQDQIRVEGYPGFTVDKQRIYIMSGNMPDVGHTYWPNSIRWAQEGALEPLSPYIANDDLDIEDFLPITLNMCKHKNTIYAMPFYLQTMGLYYNVDMLRSAGFENPPKTMNELKEMSKALTVLNDRDEIEIMGFMPDYPWIDNVLWPVMFGADFYDPEKNETTTTSDDFIRAIDYQNWFYREWGWDRISKFKLRFGTYEQQPFYKGKLAMIMGGEWIAREAREFAPDLKYGIASFPYPDDKPELKESSMISTSVVYIPSGSTHKDEAWKFIRFFESKESMLIYAKESKSLAVRKSILNSPEIKSDPDLELLAQLALNDRSRSFTPLPIVDEYLGNLSEQINLVFKQKVTPYEAMKKVKERIDPLLKKYK